MGKLAYFTVAIAAIALLVSIAASGMAGAVPDFEWSLPVVADAGVEGRNADLELGIHHDATDGYDYGIDLPSPPPQPGALFEAHFSIAHTLFPRLCKDFRGEIPNEWTLKVGSTAEDIELSWNMDDVPQGVALRLVSTESDLDMRAVNSITLPAGTHTITVVAEQIEMGQYDLTVSSTAGGLVTVPGEGTFAYDEGTVVSLVAEAEEGYRFVSWTGDVDTIADIEAASTTITMQGDYSVMANFETQYDLTIDSTVGGEVTTPGEGTFTYYAGTVVDMVAEAEEDHQFVNWTGDIDTIANIDAAETTITMDAAKNVTANFALLSYNLTTDSTDGGSVTDPGEGTFTYTYGDVVDLMAEADEGYRFVGWTGNVDTIGRVSAATTTITMQGDYSITANFDGIPPPINWPLIGGIIAAVVAVGLGIFFFRRGRVA